MLEPDTRHLLYDALRPPPGCRFDLAVGTTYSLDLPALLTVPVALAAFDAEEALAEGGIGALTLLESVRRHANRVTVFCQAGCIAVPREHRPVLTHFERSVVEVHRPARHQVFHPKLWVLRFQQDDGTLVHRVLVLSRNLTFDRSWDVVLRLDEDPDAPPCDTQPLAAFLSSFPGSAVRPVDNDHEGQTRDLAHTVTQARFAPPDPFTGIDFWPLGGAADRGWPFPERAERLLVTSPFITEGTLNRLSTVARDRRLVSRQEALDELTPGRLKDWRETLVLHEVAEAPDEGSEDADMSEVAQAEDGSEPTTSRSIQAGLHAKVYVFDEGARSSLWLGSANATGAAFGGNVEFLTRLAGPTRHCGVQACLGRDDDEQALRRLLTPYEYPEQAITPDREQRVQDLLETLTIDLASAKATLTVGPVLGSGDEVRYPLRLDLDTVPSQAVSLRARPLALPRSVGTRALDLERGCAEWEDGVALTCITPFVVLEVTAEIEGRAESARCVINADLVGAPDERTAHILQEIIDSADQFLRYLLLLLADGGFNPSAWSTLIDHFSDPRPRPAHRGWAGDFPVLEALLRALCRDPEALDHIARLVDELRSSKQGAAVIPENFDSVWQPIREVREGRRK